MWFRPNFPYMFVCLFFFRENSRQTKVLHKTLYHWHYFDSPRKVQRRFADFTSFRFSDTEAFILDLICCSQSNSEFCKSLMSEFTFEGIFQASVSWWTWPPLPRYQGTRIAYKLWWGTYPAAAYNGSNLKSPSGTEGLRPKKYVPGPLCLQPLFSYHIRTDLTIIWQCLFHRFPGIKEGLWLMKSLIAIEIFSPKFLGIKTCVLKILHTTARNLIFHKISGLEK